MKQILKSIVVSILTWEAKLALKRHRPKIITVTGNVGKTSTKDAVFAVVSHVFKARKSQKSFNSEIGLPLTILGLETAWSSPRGWIKNLIKGLRVACTGKKKFPEWLVLEIGADHPGDIEKVSEWLHPDIVVLTRMSPVPVHIEYFKDANEVLKEKMYLARALRSGGTLVVNADDPQFESAVRILDVNKVFYGTSKGALPRIVETEITYEDGALSLPRGQYAVIDLGGREAKIELRGVLGNHLMYPIAAAAGVARILHIEGIVPEALDCFDAPKGRMRILKGVTSSVIIDDTYNSSPLACAEALKTMGSLSIRGKKIAVLADMKELGENAESAHREIGRLAAEKLHMLFVVGTLGKTIAVAAREAGLSAERIYMFETATEAGETLRDLVRAGDAVLVKGSQSMRMEKTVEALLEDPKEAHKLLVRQEREWRGR
jgi:UDP-N-acetylmuramoyl-tripeptide--D-alanyl-D-alanine ligase